MGYEARYSPSILNEIRDRISLSSFVAERIPLKRAGRNFKGLCPFHSEKTPSFMVSDEKQIFHCFGCGEGGDIFRFLMKFEGITFVEAIKALAARAGVDLPKVRETEEEADKEAVRKKKWALRLNEISMQFFRNNLENSRGAAHAREYLEKRGIKNEFSKQHFLGFAENKWDSLITEFKRKGAPLELAVELGLVKRKGEDYYDFFRDRLIFPIINQRGEVIGFGGRSLSDKDEAKYINSSDSLLYHKSNSVYGLDKALPAIRKLDSVILVEGYIDLIALRQGGIENVVAPLGTALTPTHLRLLGRYTKNTILIFDGDEAGERAALRALPIFIENNMVARAVGLPNGEDPDSFIRKEGPDSLRAKIAKAQTLFEFFIDRIVDRASKDTLGKIRSLEKISPLYQMLSDPVEKSIYRRRLCDRLSLDEKAVIEKLSAVKKSRVVLENRVNSDDGVSFDRTGRLLMEALIRQPSRIRAVLSEVKMDDLGDAWSRRVYGAMNQSLALKDDPSLTEILAALSDVEMEEEIRGVALGEPWDEEELEGVIADCVELLKNRSVSKRSEEITNMLRNMDENDVKVLELLKEKSLLEKKENTGEL